MRVELEKLNGQTIKCIGVLDARGKAYINYKYINTICVIDVCDFKTGKYLTNHAWIKTNKLKGILKGSKFSFVATVEPYYKVYKGQRVMDYQLVDIKYVKVL